MCEKMDLRDLIPESYGEKYRLYKSLEHELKDMEATFKDKLVDALENSNELKSLETQGIKFSFVKGSVRTSIDSKKLQEEEPAIYEKYLKETQVKSTYKTTIVPID